MRKGGWIIFVAVIILTMIGEIYFRDLTQLIWLIIGIVIAMLLFLYNVFDKKLSKPYKKKDR